MTFLICNIFKTYFYLRRYLGLRMSVYICEPFSIELEKLLVGKAVNNCLFDVFWGKMSKTEKTK